MNQDDVLSVTLWGTRGSIPTPGPNTLRYGGETTCFEVRAGPHTLVIDCGSGVRACGQNLARRNLASLDVLFTHTHLDHVCGLPFFSVAYDPAVAVTLWAGHIPPGGTLEEIVERLMSPPIFPVATSALNNTSFRNFKPGPSLHTACGLTVGTQRLNHPGNAVGYRFDWRGSSIAIITDHEHGHAAIDDAVAEFVAGVDVMIYDSMYLDTEYPRFVGWGHSTPGEALALAKRAGVRRPVLFHHDPSRTDAQLDALAEWARREVPNARVARQGETYAFVDGKMIGEAAAASV